MKVIGREMLNTGGGCMVLNMAIANGYELKSITVNDETIVGWSHEIGIYEEDYDDYFLWSVDSWKELIEKVGIDLAADVYKHFVAGWKWSDCINDTHIIKSYILLEMLTDISMQLSDNWCEEMDTAYPFKRSFDEITTDVAVWKNAVYSKVRKQK